MTYCKHLDTPQYFTSSHRSFVLLGSTPLLCNGSYAILYHPAYFTDLGRQSMSAALPSGQAGHSHLQQTLQRAASQRHGQIYTCRSLPLNEVHGPVFTRVVCPQWKVGCYYVPMERPAI